MKVFSLIGMLMFSIAGCATTGPKSGEHVPKFSVGNCVEPLLEILTQSPNLQNLFKVAFMKVEMVGSDYYVTRLISRTDPTDSQPRLMALVDMDEQSTKVTCPK